MLGVLQGGADGWFTERTLVFLFSPGIGERWLQKIICQLSKSCPPNQNLLCSTVCSKQASKGALRRAEANPQGRLAAWIANITPPFLRDLLVQGRSSMANLNICSNAQLRPRKVQIDGDWMPRVLEIGRITGLCSCSKTRAQSPGRHARPSPPGCRRRVGGRVHPRGEPHLQESHGLLEC